MESPSKKRPTGVTEFLETAPMKRIHEARSKAAKRAAETRKIKREEEEARIQKERSLLNADSAWKEEKAAAAELQRRIDAGEVHLTEDGEVIPLYEPPADE